MENSSARDELAKQTEKKLEKKVTLLENILNNLRILEVIKNRRNHYRRRIDSTIADIQQLQDSIDGAAQPEPDWHSLFAAGDQPEE